MVSTTRPAIAGCCILVLALSALSRLEAQEGGAAPVRPELRGINIDPKRPWSSPVPATLSELGITRVRLVYKQSHTETVEAVGQYIEGGAFVTVIVNNESVDLRGFDYQPSRFTKADWEKYRRAYAYTVVDLALHLKGFGDRVAYQLWNEQNLEASWIPPAVYGPMAAEAAAIIKKAHPTARVLLGPVQHNGTAVGYLNAALRAEPTMLDLIDELGLHTYGELDSLQPSLERYHRLFGKPLAITEWGRCGLSEAVGLGQMRRYLGMLDGLPFVSQAYYFAWSEVQHPGCGYGLSRPLNRPGSDGGYYELKELLPSAFSMAEPARAARGAEGAIAWALSQVGSHAYDGWCLRFARIAFQGVSTAASADAFFRELRDAGSPIGLLAHQAPRGALVFFEAAPGNPYGHVGISLGDGDMVSALGLGRLTGVRVTPLDYVGAFAGWVEPPPDWVGRESQLAVLR